MSGLSVLYYWHRTTPFHPAHVQPTILFPEAELHPTDYSDCILGSRHPRNNLRQHGHQNKKGRFTPQQPCQICDRSPITNPDLTIKTKPPLPTACTVQCSFVLTTWIKKKIKPSPSLHFSADTEVFSSYLLKICRAASPFTKPHAKVAGVQILWLQCRWAERKKKKPLTSEWPWRGCH